MRIDYRLINIKELDFGVRRQAPPARLPRLSPPCSLSTAPRECPGYAAFGAGQSADRSAHSKEGPLPLAGVSLLFPFTQRPDAVPEVAFICIKVVRAIIASGFADVIEI